MYADPDNYVGQYIKLTGKVFYIEKDEDNIYFQMHRDTENLEGNTIVKASKEVFGDIEDEDYVKIDGYIEGTFEGENVMGGKITAPAIVAEKVEKSSYKDVVAPTTKEVEINDTRKANMKGVTLTLEKVEFSEKETRVYISIDNKSKEDYYFNYFETKIIQNSKQYSSESNYDADYDEFEFNISPDVKDSGVLVFDKIDVSDFTFICEGHSDDYSLDEDNYKFNIKL